MSRVIRSIWLKAIVLSSLVLFVAQCGDESEVVIVDLPCQAKALETGIYVFELVSVNDHDCPVDLEDIINDQDIPPIELPGYEELPYRIEDFDIPIVEDNVTGVLEEQGDRIRLTTEPETIQGSLGSLPFTARVTGFLCPVSGSEVGLQLDLLLTAYPPLLDPISCTAQIVADGNR